MHIAVTIYFLWDGVLSIFPMLPKASLKLGPTAANMRSKSDGCTDPMFLISLSVSSTQMTIAERERIVSTTTLVSSTVMSIRYRID